MADREGFKITAGGGKKLNIIRYGRDEMTQHELPSNEADGDIVPGMALQRTVSGGDPVFEHHDGTEVNPVYVAVEARGRGMDAQTSEGYDQDDAVIAVLASGGGLNLMMADGETATDGDSTLVPEADTGYFIVETSEGWTYAQASESLDLAGGASEPGLIGAEVHN